MKQRIYLGNPCRGRLYHLIMTLIKQHRRIRVALWWIDPMEKHRNSMKCKMQGDENLTYMQVSKKTTSPRDDVSVTHLRKTPNQKKIFIRMTQRSPKKKPKHPPSQEYGKRGPNWGKRSQKSL
jgi:hypothetical protein